MGKPPFPGSNPVGTTPRVESCCTIRLVTNQQPKWAAELRTIQIMLLGLLLFQRLLAKATAVVDPVERS